MTDPIDDELAATAEALRARAAPTEIPRQRVFTSEEMLRRCVWVRNGQRVAVLPEDDEPQCEVLTWTEFRDAYKASGEMHVNDRGRESWVEYAQRWASDDRRMAVSDVCHAIGWPRVVRFNGAATLNTWTAVPREKPPRGWEKKAALFWEHVRWLIPEPELFERFRRYLGHTEQAPQELPHHGWLMQTEAFGVGRNWVASVLARVWPGEVAPNVNLAQLLDSGFNGQISGKRLACVDELYIGSSSRSRYAVEAKLRELITEEWRTINPKFRPTHQERNAMRWLLFSNYVDALPLPAHDRRFEVVNNPARPHEGGADYYTRLYAALADREFIASVAHSLAAMDISEFNPGAMPMLSAAKRDVIAASRSELEEELDTLFSAQWKARFIVNEDLLQIVNIAPTNARDTRHLRAVMRRLGHRQILGSLKVGGKAVRVWRLKAEGEAFAGENSGQEPTSFSVSQSAGQVSVEVSVEVAVAEERAAEAFRTLVRDEIAAYRSADWYLAIPKAAGF